MTRLLAKLIPAPPSGRGEAKRRARSTPEGAGEASARASVSFQTQAAFRAATLRPVEVKRRVWLPWIIALVLGMGFAFPAFAIDPLPFQSTAQRERFQHLTSELRCMVCQDESLLASNADFAKQLRRQIFDMMRQGKSDKEIKDWLVARYSTFILYDPPLQSSTLALWFGTPAILLAGGIVVVVLLRRRTRPASAIAEDPGDDW